MNGEPLHPLINNWLVEEVQAFIDTTRQSVLPLLSPRPGRWAGGAAVSTGLEAFARPSSARVWPFPGLRPRTAAVQPNQQTKPEEGHKAAAVHDGAAPPANAFGVHSLSGALSRKQEDSMVLRSIKQLINCHRRAAERTMAWTIGGGSRRKIKRT